MKLRAASVALLALFGSSGALAQGNAEPPRAGEEKPPEASSEAPRSASDEPPPTTDAGDAPPAPSTPASEAPPTAPTNPSPSPQLTDAAEPPPLRGPAGEPTPTGRAAPPPAVVDDEGYELNGDPTVDNLEPVKEPSLFMVALLWDSTLPLGGTSDFVNAFSAQGFSIEVKYLGLGNFVLGGFVAWHTIAQKGQYEETVGNVTVSGTMMREFSANPLLARAHYTFRNGKREDQKGVVVPYVAGGVGGSRVMRRTDFGVSVHSEDSWRWTLAPEVGIEYQLKPLTVLAAVRANYLFSAGNSPEEIYMNFSLGVGLE